MLLVCILITIIVLFVLYFCDTDKEEFEYTIPEEIYQNSVPNVIPRDLFVYEKLNKIKPYTDYCINENEFKYDCQKINSSRELPKGETRGETRGEVSSESTVTIKNIVSSKIAVLDDPFKLDIQSLFEPYIGSDFGIITNIDSSEYGLPSEINSATGTDALAVSQLPSYNKVICNKFTEFINKKNDINLFVSNIDNTNSTVTTALNLNIFSIKFDIYEKISNYTKKISIVVNMLKNGATFTLTLKEAKIINVQNDSSWNITDIFAFKNDSYFKILNPLGLFSPYKTDATVITKDYYKVAGEGTKE